MGEGGKWKRRGNKEEVELLQLVKLFEIRENEYLKNRLFLILDIRI